MHDITNITNLFDFINNVRRFQTEKSQVQQATQQLCQLQVSFNKELIANEKLRKELSTLKDLFIEEMSRKSKELEKEAENEKSGPSFD